MNSIMLRFNVLPKLPNSMNHNNWRAKWAQTKKWEKLVYHKLAETQIKPREPFSSVSMTITRGGSRKPDYDNMVASCKPVIDALIRNGLIVDDSPDHIKKVEFNFEKTKRDQVFTCIEIKKI